MKYILVALVLSSFSLVGCNKQETKSEAPASKLVNDQETSGSEWTKAEEDCDDKAKKPVEITPETVSLSGGDAGCTLE